MNPPRVLIAGTASGSGKTTAVCAVLTLLKRRGVKVRACKCGPDYIDPMFHASALGVPSTNLDPFFCDPALLRQLLCDNVGEDLTVIEGVMGYYDGTGETGTENSTFTVADRTGTPVILVADAKGAAASLLSVIEGFLRFYPNSRIRGVLFNRMKAHTYAQICDLMRAHFGEAVVPVGFIPAFPDAYTIPSRHLGLVTAEELHDLRQKLDAVADLCTQTIDLEQIAAIAQTAEELPDDAPEIPVLPPVHIAYARDAAFCFYYSDTLRLLQKTGATLLPFSPLANEPVPPEADGLLLGGGYPELYAEQLEKNGISKESVRRAVCGGMPTIAECGGFQYLGQSLDGKKMCCVLEHESFPAGRLVRFGYVTLTARRDGLFGDAGTVLRGHEFHYWDSTDVGDGFTAQKLNGSSRLCAVYTPTLYAGYPHLYLCANPAAAQAFYRKCMAYKEDRHDRHISE